MNTPFGSVNGSAQADEDAAWQAHTELSVTDPTSLFEELHVTAQTDDENGTNMDYSPRLDPPTTPEPHYRTPVVFVHSPL